MSRSALVTGAAGFIGSHLCERLLDDGWHLLGVDSFAPTYDTSLRRATAEKLGRSPGFQFIEGDLLKIDIAELLYGVDAVFHLAARPGVRASWEDFQWSLDANVMATKKLLYAIVRHNERAPFVFASSSSVYGAARDYPTRETDALHPISPYGVTKASAEQLVSAYVSQYSINATTLRYFTVYGPRQRQDMAFTRWITAALANRPITLFGDGSAVRDFTYVTDVVTATIASLKAEGGTYNVAGGSPASLTEAIDLILEITKSSSDVIHLPRAKGDPSRTGGDTSLIEKEMGWQPEVGLEEGIRHQVDWLKGR